MKKPDSSIIVIFGASGDLTRRKLIPALYDLFEQKLMPDNFAVLGASRTEYSDDAFREKMKDAVKSFGDSKLYNEDKINDFCSHLFYTVLDTQNKDDYSKVRERLDELNKRFGKKGNYIFYLSTPPSLYETIPVHLAAMGLNIQKGNSEWRRLIVEKPFGYDLGSAVELNSTLLKHYNESTA